MDSESVLGFGTGSGLDHGIGTANAGQDTGLCRMQELDGICRKCKDGCGSMVVGCSRIRSRGRDCGRSGFDAVEDLVRVGG